VEGVGAAARTDAAATMPDEGAAATGPAPSPTGAVVPAPVAGTQPAPATPTVAGPVLQVDWAIPGCCRKPNAGGPKSVPTSPPCGITCP